MKFDEIKNYSEIEKEALLSNPVKLEEIIGQSMSEKRFLHSKSVAETAVHIAEMNKIDTEKAYLAGILHDICKEMDKEQQLQILKENDPQKLNYPIKAIHGYTAKYYLKEIFPFIDESVLSAIYNHTILEDLNELNMIIYIADKREPLRNIEDGILEKSYTDLYGAYKDLVMDVERYLIKNGENSIRSSF